MNKYKPGNILTEINAIGIVFGLVIYFILTNPKSLFPLSLKKDYSYVRESS